MTAGMGVIEEVGALVRAVLARFTQGMKQGQRVVGAPWPSAEGEGAYWPALKRAAASAAHELVLIHGVMDTVNDALCFMWGSEAIVTSHTGMSKVSVL